MTQFDPDAYGATCAALMRSAPPVELGPGEPNRDAYDALRKLDYGALFGERPVVDRKMADCCRSGLWLLHHFLDDSHHISQSVETPTGSYWHGIMHRREPDFSNAKYWFRRVGTHPVFDSLGAEADRIAASQDTAFPGWAAGAPWDAFRFVDLCEEALRGDEKATKFCSAVAEAEWQLLFDFCYRSATA